MEMIEIDGNQRGKKKNEEEKEFCKLSSWEWKFRANVQRGW